jgi:predicted ATP-grasp superfamily ATP-dependent carboligase
MARVALTGGRAPVTLELARLLARAGHTVVVAESARWPLTLGSRAVARSVRVPPPRHDPAGFAAALAALLIEERIDLLVPTCEEIFYVARARDQLAAHSRVLAEPLEKLHALHHKGRFAEQARGYGLAVPETRLLTSPAEVAALPAPDAWVLKPAYSRFAARTLLPPHRPGALARVQPTPAAPWVAQRYVRGRALCTYSVAHGGRLAAHAAYPVTFSAGQGAAIYFEALKHAAARAWVETFVAREGFTGQIAFDFIEDAAGQLWALECNPRATSGVHLLAAHPGFAGALWASGPEVITPPPGEAARLGAAMWLYGLRGARLSAWWAAMRRSREVIGQWRDPRPALMQFGSLAEFGARSLRLGIDPLAASTEDIEWNGEP